jgi:glucose-6-phosphate isomerase
MPYKQHIENSFFEKIGENGLKSADFDMVKPRAASILERLANEVKSSQLDLLNFKNYFDKLPEIKKIIADLRAKYQHLVILGTGGATLTGQCLTGIFEKKELDKKLTFVDNVDPVTFDYIIDHLDLKNTGFLVISKSGGTIETISQFVIFLKLYKEKFGEDSIKNHFHIINGNEGKSNLREISKQFNINVIDHEKIGGRFSIFSHVGLIPAGFIGVDVEKILTGAKIVCDDALSGQKQNSAPSIGAIYNYLFIQKNINSTVMMPYVDRLKNFTVWFSQIWAESLGKSGKGSTPIRALGTLDQHSQLQLFLDGKRDKIFNFIKVNNKNIGSTLDTKLLGIRDYDYLDGKKVGDVMNAACDSTYQTLINHKMPVRIFELDYVNEESLGAICMHFILETLITGYLLEINPFGQPAVEEGKVLSVNLLKKNA